MTIPRPKRPESRPSESKIPLINNDLATNCPRIITATVLIFYQIDGEVRAFKLGNSTPMPEIAEKGVFVPQIARFAS